MALWMDAGSDPISESEKADLEAIAAIKEAAAVELKVSIKRFLLPASFSKSTCFHAQIFTFQLPWKSYQAADFVMSLAFVTCFQKFPSHYHGMSIMLTQGKLLNCIIRFELEFLCF
ncbi:hypothetical protein BHM03_00014996 [Ensete ventricosum]|uniref:Uncharacterized protein n=1 Tax=Ensete ventricosum TaxID=4639 RepID=A0A445MEI0_ENSVE|nr:hypothetical protein BHM03_00014996 [Ensete ventricosum]